MSTVIKAGQTGAIARRLGTVDLADHLREAAAVVERARERASAIIADAEEESRRVVKAAGERARAEGYEKGFAEGTAAGNEAALAQSKAEFADRHASLAAMFQAAITAIDESKEQMRLTAEKDLLDFAIMVASQMTLAIGDLRREAACENFRRSLSMVMSKTDVSIRCHAKDVETLRVFAESVLESALAGRRIRVVEDNAVSPGGCVLQSGSSEVDASLETQVAEMVTILLGRPADA